MRAGKLRETVTFEREQEVPDGGGGSSTVWTELFSRRANIRRERGREKVEAGRLTAQSVAFLTIRSDSESRTLTESDRVVFDGKAHQIRSIINPDGRNRALEITVEGGVVT